ncbi:MAG: DUF998 domain-containing protein [Rubrobacteraceae bacterium]
MNDRGLISEEVSATKRKPKLEEPRSQTRYQKIGGALLFVAGVIIYMGIITAEALYPAAYNTAQNEISDLGATRPPDSVILQPSATIFDVTMIVTGLMIIGGAYCVHRVFKRGAVTVPLALLGIGALGVGIFPGNHAVMHPIFAMLTFIAGGLAAILAYKVEAQPMRYISVALGGIALLTLLLAIFLGEAGLIGVLGDGGTERWVAYPVVLWLVGFGGYLLGLSPQRQTQPRWTDRP